MSVPVLQSLLADFATVIGALGLTGSPNVVVRKGAKKEPGVDPAGQVTIAQSPKPEQYKKIAFGHMAVGYEIEVTQVAANNDDWSSNLNTYAANRQAVERAFGPPYSTPLLPTAPGVWNLEIVPDEFLNRGDMAENIDRWVVKVVVWIAY